MQSRWMHRPHWHPWRSVCGGCGYVSGDCSRRSRDSSGVDSGGRGRDGDGTNSGDRGGSGSRSADSGSRGSRNADAGKHGIHKTSSSRGSELQPLA